MNLTLNSHTHCQATQASRTSQSLSKNVSKPSHRRKKSTIAQHCIRVIAGKVANIKMTPHQDRQFNKKTDNE